MKLGTPVLAVVLVLLGCNVAAAANAQTYQMIQESLLLVFSLAALIMSTAIFLALKGGSLSVPWIFFVMAFALAGAGGVSQLLDMFHVLFHQYDLRGWFVISKAGSMLLLLVGLILYKKGLK